MATTDNSGVIWVSRSYAQCGHCKSEFLSLPQGGPLTPQTVEKAYRERGWVRCTPTPENGIAGAGWVCPACAASLRRATLDRSIKKASSVASSSVVSSSQTHASTSTAAKQWDPTDESPYPAEELRS